MNKNNKSGYYRVSIEKDSKTKQGFSYVYSVKSKKLGDYKKKSVSIEKLKEKVLKAGYVWIDYSKSLDDFEEHIRYTIEKNLVSYMVQKKDYYYALSVVSTMLRIYRDNYKGVHCLYNDLMSITTLSNKQRKEVKKLFVGWL